MDIYAYNFGAYKFIKQILLDIKGQMGSGTITVGEFNTPLSSTDRSSRQNQQRNFQVIPHHGSNGFDIHSNNTLSNDCGI
jgi:hypothetical protein